MKRREGEGSLNKLFRENPKTLTGIHRVMEVLSGSHLLILSGHSRMNHLVVVSCYYMFR